MRVCFLPGCISGEDDTLCYHILEVREASPPALPNFSTCKLAIGCLVTCNTYRNAALLSDMAKTVDHISNGRLILGIGAGWFERDYEEFGYDFGTAGGRLVDLERSLEIIRHRWEIDVPSPVRNPIPILVGGGGEKKTLRIAARYANMTHTFGDPETLVHILFYLRKLKSKPDSEEIPMV